MDIAALVNPVSEAPPRRSPSGSHNILAPSPALSNATIPTPTLSSRPRPTMSRKRKRHDPKPIWAAQEKETYDGKVLQEHIQDIQQALPAPPTPQSQPQPPPIPTRNGPPPSTNGGPPQSLSVRELVGYQRPISDDAKIYDEVSRKVCDFIWNTVIINEDVRKAIAESPGIQVEVEARWGQLIERASKQRLRTMIDTEGVVNGGASENLAFESTMTLEQHKRMNKYLNAQVSASADPTAMRAKVGYKHTREIDQFFELDQDGFNRLPPMTRAIISNSKQRQRIRITRDEKDPSKILDAIIKCRVGNLEISSPQTEWDYRIGVNLEIKFPGPLDGLQVVIEAGRSVESMKRKKDRMSYSWLGAYQVDLTQVSQGDLKNHELELELDSKVLLQNAENTQKGLGSSYEQLIDGMMNNLRVLSREVTPAG